MTNKTSITLRNYINALAVLPPEWQQQDWDKIKTCLSGGKFILDKLTEMVNGQAN